MKSFCIIGLGEFGMTLARELAGYGCQIMAIDVDGEKINEIADVVTNAVIGDPTNDSVLRACGAADYDCAVVCLQTNMNDNILLSIMLKELGIKKVISRASNEKHKTVLERLGIDTVVFPERDTAEKLAYVISKNNITDYIEFDGYKLIECKVPDAWEGKSLFDLDIRKKYGVSVIAVRSAEGERTVDVSPNPTRKFKCGEMISVVGEDKDIDKFASRLS